MSNLKRKNIIMLIKAFQYLQLDSINKDQINKLASQHLRGSTVRTLIRKEKKRKQKNADFKKKYLDYLNSPAWTEIRIEMLTAHPKCQRCGQYKRGLQVHHKTYKNIFKEEPEDLEVLCVLCHREEHNLK